MAGPSTTEVFFSYAQEDSELRDRIDKHLGALKRKGLIRTWHDGEIKAGTEYSTEIIEKLDAADLILLLVSSDFIDSEFCWGLEMKRAMERHEAGEALVIPIILRPVDDWDSAPFGKLQALPKKGRPVTDWDDQDAAAKNVAAGIRKALEAPHRKSAPGQSEFPAQKEPDPKGKVQPAKPRFLPLTVLALIALLVCWHWAGWWPFGTEKSPRFEIASGDGGHRNNGREVELGTSDNTTAAPTTDGALDASSPQPKRPAGMPSPPGIFVRRSGSEWVSSVAHVNGAVWILGHESLYRLDGRGRTKIQLAKNSTAHVISAVDQELWVGTSLGLYLLDGETLSPLRHVSRGVHAISVSDDVVWLGTSNGALRILKSSLREADGPRHSEFLEKQRVHFIDVVAGTLWFASTRNAYYLDGDEPRSVFANDREVTAVRFLAGETWVIAPGRGGVTIKCFTFRNGQLSEIFSDLPVSTLGVVNDAVWMGDINGGLYAPDGIQIAYAAEGEGMQDSVNAIVELDGEVWIGTGSSLYRGRRGAGPFQKYPQSLGNLGVRSFLKLLPEDASRAPDLWMVSSDGVFSFERGVAAHARVEAPGLLPHRIMGRRISLNDKVSFLDAQHVTPEGGTRPGSKAMTFVAAELGGSPNCRELFDHQDAVAPGPFSLSGLAPVLNLCLRDEWGNVFGPQRFHFILMTKWHLALVIALVVAFLGRAIITRANQRGA